MIPFTIFDGLTLYAQVMPQLSLLGDCLLAGSLDVVYHHETLAPLDPPIKVKYLGAFLYGGWILLVKVLKNKVYEPRHWFPLSSVYMTDIPEEDGMSRQQHKNSMLIPCFFNLALLPASFRLSCGDHHFEFAAACPQVGSPLLCHICGNFLMILAGEGTLDEANQVCSHSIHPSKQ